MPARWCQSQNNMNILICFKTVPNLDLLPAADFVADGQLRVDTGFIPAAVNCYDESALEMAREAAQNAKEDVALTALTIGGEASETTLKTLYALGYTHGVRIEPDDDIRFAPERVAAAVAAYAGCYPQDVILTGVQSPEGDNGQMPLLLAERLGWPCVTQVTGLRLVGEGMLEVDSMTDNGGLTQKLRPPVVLAVGDAPSTCLKVPTLKDRMQRSNRPIQVLHFTDFVPVVQSGACLQALRQRQNARQGLVIEGGSSRDKAKVLYETYIKRVLEQL